jgi:hypothetical protein
VAPPALLEEFIICGWTLAVLSLLLPLIDLIEAALLLLLSEAQALFCLLLLLSVGLPACPQLSSKCADQIQVPLFP